MEGSDFEAVCPALEPHHLLNSPCSVYCPYTCTHALWCRGASVSWDWCPEGKVWAAASSSSKQSQEEGPGRPGGSQKDRDSVEVTQPGGGGVESPKPISANLDWDAALPCPAGWVALGSHFLSGSLIFPMCQLGMLIGCSGEETR